MWTSADFRQSPKGGKEAMLQVEFTEADIQAFAYERYHHPHPRVQRKMEAMWLKSQKLKHKEICRLTGISSTTFTEYLRSYQEGGIEALRELNFNQPESELKKHSQSLEAHFRQHPPATIKEAMSVIETMTGLKRSEPQVRKFLDHLGLKRRKTGMIPAKVDLEKQEEFKKKS